MGGALKLSWNRDLASALLLALLSFALLAPGIGGGALLSQGDEPMHAATVRESLERESFFTPVLNNAPNYFKPPLLFWESMAFEALLGPSRAALRAPSLIAGILSALVLFAFLRRFRVRRGAAFALALIYVCSLGTFKFARLLMMEQSLALAMLACVATFITGVLHPSPSRGRLWILTAGGVAALAFFYKGPLFQVYGGLLCLVWALPRIWRWKAATDGRLQWLGRAAIGPVGRTLLWFHGPLVVPIAWWIAQATSGEGALQHFVIFENLAKFAEPNQSSLRIANGWLLYSLPWSAALIGLVYASVRKLARDARTGGEAGGLRSPAREAGWICFWTAIALTMFHLWPNRKDAYYILPASPLVAAAAGLWLSDSAFRRRLEAAAVWNLLVPLAGGTLLALIAWRLAGGMLWIAAVLAAPALLSIAGAAARRGRMQTLAWLAPPVVWLCTFQFLFLPMIDRPLLPVRVEGQIPPAQSVCIVSVKPWHALQLAMAYPARRFTHALPGAVATCRPEERALLVSDPELADDALLARKPAATWKILDESTDASPLELWEHPERAFKEARLLSPQGADRGGSP